MQLELAELDQVFTAKSIDRGVQDTCSTGSTGRITVMELVLPVLVPVLVQEPVLVPVLVMYRYCEM